MIDDTFFRKVSATATFLKNRLNTLPGIVTMLGTGQGTLPEELCIETVIDYADIPNFPKTTVPGHRGRLVLGKLHDTPCLFLQGRFHCYEGYDAAEITLPLRAISILGAKILLITNTAGGLNLDFAAGELMAITDHINFIGTNPLRGVNFEQWGPRFPDMSQPYSRRILAIAEEAAANLKIKLHHGIYVAIPGPSLETPAETRFLNRCGADAVGMSTVPEVIVATHAGLEVFGLSIIANVNNPNQMQPIRLDEVLTQVAKAEGNSRQLLAEIIRKISLPTPAEESCAC
ncbi:MAG: purine-nucleoside phosphorylase [Desulfobulbaceae bacterium]|nr:purine-nucleoside phosphorylase [Desulfobulbaceae bacterium]